MTTNRYLAEVLEGSRETLLAFVDRIAFVVVRARRASPIRRASGASLRSQVGGARPRPLVAPLTIQDLDVLQAAADRVVVPDEICDGARARCSSTSTPISRPRRSTTRRSCRRATSRRAPRCASARILRARSASTTRS